MGEVKKSRTVDAQLLIKKKNDVMNLKKNQPRGVKTGREPDHAYTPKRHSQKKKKRQDKKGTILGCACKHGTRAKFNEETDEKNPKKGIGRGEETAQASDDAARRTSEQGSPIRREEKGQTRDQKRRLTARPSGITKKRLCPKPSRPH